MGPIKICITSWNRVHFLEQVITKINERTKPGSFEIIVYDNASDLETRSYLQNCLQSNLISNVIFDNVNSGCLKPKIVFHSLVGQDEPFYVVSDNDILPPDLTPDWLEQMVTIMENNPDVALLTPQLPPVWLQEPYQRRGNIILAKAVGNTFKMCRRFAIPEEFKQVTDRYGDDGVLCKLLSGRGWKIAFAADLFCYNLERTIDSYGYTKDQLAADPRKFGYDPDSKKHNYDPEDWKTLKPPSHLIF